MTINKADYFGHVFFVNDIASLTTEGKVKALVAAGFSLLESSAGHNGVRVTAERSLPNEVPLRLTAMFDRYDSRGRFTLDMWAKFPRQCAYALCIAKIFDEANRSMQFWTGLEVDDEELEAEDNEA